MKAQTLHGYCVMLSKLSPAPQANEELKYTGFWSMQTKSTPSLPNKHSWSRRTRKMLLQNTLSRSGRFECEILYRKFTVLKVTP